MANKINLALKDDSTMRLIQRMEAEGASLEEIKDAVKEKLNA